jgi:hypothetical protein
MSFKVKDRVRFVGSTGEDVGNGRITNPIGTVKFVSPPCNIGGEYNCDVEFDENVGGHSIDGNTPIGHGWCCSSFDLELINKKIQGNSKLEFNWL